MKRLLSPATNLPGWMTLGFTAYAVIQAILNARAHHTAIGPAVIVAALAAGLAAYTRTQVTPVADPRDGNGQPLISRGSATVILGNPDPLFRPPLPGTTTGPVSAQPAPGGTTLMTNIAGIDVSNFQGQFAWSAWKAKIGFGWCKATEGTGFQDPDFAWNWGAMHAVGLPRGAYHFAHPGSDPVAQADYFLAFVKAHGLHPGDMLALDLEVADGKTPAEVNEWAERWCERVRFQAAAPLIYPPLVYTMRSFAEGGYCAGLGGYPLWLATGGAQVVAPVGPWTSIAMEQTGTRGTPPVDADLLLGDAEALADLGIPQPPPPQPGHTVIVVPAGATHGTITWQ